MEHNIQAQTNLHSKSSLETLSLSKTLSLSFESKNHSKKRDMAFQQQLETFVRSVVLGVIQECKANDLMVSGAEEYLMKDDFIIKKLLSVTELSSSTATASSTSESVTVASKKKRVTKKERASSDKPTRVPSSTQLLKGRLMKRIKTEFAHLVDTAIEIPNSKGTGKVNFHQCTMGTAEYASRIVLNSSSTEEEAIVGGMIEFNKKHQVTYFKVTESTVLSTTTPEEAAVEQPETVTSEVVEEAVVEQPEETATVDAVTEEATETVVAEDDDSDDDSDDNDSDDSDSDSDNDDDMSLGTNKFGLDFD